MTSTFLMIQYVGRVGRELKPYGIQVYVVETLQRKIVETVFALLELQLEER